LITKRRSTDLLVGMALSFFEATRMQLPSLSITGMLERMAKRVATPLR
jgi:hypothetical protein